MPAHDIATDEVLPYLQAVIGFHPELADAGVTFDALFALPVDGVPAGVKHQGFPAPMTYKINGPTLRKRRIPDVTFVIEADEWGSMPDDARRAMLDHYLSFLTLARDAKGVPKEDDALRPKLKAGLTDYRIGGFRAVAARHGEHSIEVRDAAAFRENFADLLYHEPAESVA